MTNAQYEASLKMTKGSSYKFNQVAAVIRKLDPQSALNSLVHINRSSASIIQKLLKSAVSNAYNKDKLSISQLKIKTVFVDKALTLKRFHARGRGKSSIVQKHFTKIRIILEKI
jgi:large subunit ribosomal protein L22